MTDKIKGYEDSHLVNCYRPRFTSDSGHIQNTNSIEYVNGGDDPWEHCNNIGKEQNWGAVCTEYMKPLHEQNELNDQNSAGIPEQNGGDEPKEFIKCPYDTRCGNYLSQPSPTYTREKLVELLNFSYLDIMDIIRSYKDPKEDAEQVAFEIGVFFSELRRKAFTQIEGGK